jgi:hypothetical protein
MAWGWPRRSVCSRNIAVNPSRVPSIDAGYLEPKVGRKESLESFTPLMTT